MKRNNSKNYTPTPIKEQIVREKLSGKSCREIAANFNVNFSTVSRICSKNRNQGNVHGLSKTGRPKKTSDAQDRLLVRQVRVNPTLSSADVSKQAQEQFRVTISRRTASRILNRYHLLARRPAKKPLMQERHRVARLQFALQHQYWTIEQWGKVLWSDETRFNFNHPDGGTYIRRPQNKRYSPKYVKQTMKFGGGGLMAWGCFSRDGIGPLVRIHGNMDAPMYRDILVNHM